MVRFRLQVPASNERGPAYVEQALAALHQSNPQRLPITLEIGCWSGQTGLAIQCTESLAATVRSQLFASYPDARLEKEPESPPQKDQSTCWTDVFLHPALYPIKRYPQFADPQNRYASDPIAALLAVIARSPIGQLKSAIQIQIRPARMAQQRRHQRILRVIQLTLPQRFHGWTRLYLELALSPFRRWRFLGWLHARAFRLLSGHAPHETNVPPSNRSHDREDLAQAANDKLQRQLFECAMRIVVHGSPKLRAEVHTAVLELAGALGPFSLPHLASFRIGPIRHRAAMPPLRMRFLLSAEELATLWHPPTLVVQTPALGRVDSIEREPPAQLPTPQDAALALLGLATFRGRSRPFGILADDRRRHMLIEGKTGMGKTSLLQQLICSDICRGEGVGLIDPHGDLADALLTRIPARRTNDVVLFDVADTDFPLAFNVLQCRDSAQRPLVASSVLSAFKKLYGETWGPRLEHILRNCLLTLLEFPETSLLSVLRLLSDGAYRHHVLTQVRDPVVHAFWKYEFDTWPAKFRAEAIAPIQNKIGHFATSPILRNVLGQSKSTVSLRRVMDEGKILIVNLSKGRIGDDASSLLGSLLVTSLQLAAMSRANLPEDQRRDYHLFVDEFQNFATDSFATILSEARKYHLSLTLANQYLAQMDEATLAAVLGNVGTLISFQIGAQDAPLIAEQLGMEIQPQDLLRLPRYQAYIRLLIEGQPSRPFSMRTLPPSQSLANAHRAQVIRRYSRQRYSRPAAAVEASLAKALTN